MTFSFSGAVHKREGCTVTKSRKVVRLKDKKIKVALDTSSQDQKVGLERRGK